MARLTDSTLPIGYSLKTKVLVLDENLKEVGVGEVVTCVKSRISQATGAILSGRSVFSPDPPARARIYLTGDVGLRRADGRLIHVGEGLLVKVRGFRIDVGKLNCPSRP
jgi:non-ribosomal peptide synthetase component F